MNLNSLFHPKSIVIFGLSTRDNNVGRMILQNLRDWNFDGPVHGVSPGGGQIDGTEIFPSLADVPGSPDLAVIVTPARFVPDVLDECGARGVRFAVIETAGFSELGDEGEQLADAVREKAAAHNILFVGPNCLGVINSEARLCLPFVPLGQWTPGPVSVISQSGGVGLNLLAWLMEVGLNPNKFASIGNKYSLDETDFLEYMLNDPGTEIVLMLLESIVRGRRLAELAANSPKPVIIMKTGGTRAGSRRAFSHTAALAGDDAVINAALHQAGAVRVRKIYDLVTFAAMFTQPPMRGNRLAVISPAGGYTVLGADLAEQNGFLTPPYSPDTLDAVTNRSRAGVIRLDNPMDMGDAYMSDTVLLAIQKAIAEPEKDAVCVIYGRRPLNQYTGLFEIMRKSVVPDAAPLAAQHDKPLVFAIPSPADVAKQLRDQVAVPVYGQPEEAFEALAAWRDFCSRRPSLPPPVAPQQPNVASWFQNRPSGPVVGAAAFQLLRDAGIPASECAEADTPESAARAAETLGWPVALKINSARLAHKSDAGGVRLNINSIQQLVDNAAELLDILKKANAPGNLLLQKMAPPGAVELILGLRRDPAFGPVVLVGLGGVFAELLKDTVVRLAPVSIEQARDALLQLRGAALLQGYRGAPPADIEAAAQAIVALSQLGAACDRISELDINPLLVYPSSQGALAVDCRIALA